MLLCMLLCLINVVNPMKNYWHFSVLSPPDRLCYWVAAALGSSLRGFGFALSFLPMVTMLVANMYFIFVLDAEGGLFAKEARAAQESPSTYRQRFWGWSVAPKGLCCQIGVLSIHFLNSDYKDQIFSELLNASLSVITVSIIRLWICLLYDELDKITTIYMIVF